MEEEEFKSVKQTLYLCGGQRLSAMITAAAQASGARLIAQPFIEEGCLYSGAPLADWSRLQDLRAVIHKGLTHIGCKTNSELMSASTNTMPSVNLLESFVCLNRMEYDRPSD